MNEDLNRKPVIDVRFEDFNGIVFKHFCPFCMEEMEETVCCEEKTVKCSHCSKEMELNWKPYTNDMENFLSEKIRAAAKAADAYSDEDTFCEVLSDVIEEVYQLNDKGECYEAAREVIEFAGDYEDEHDIAKQMLELLDIPSLVNESFDFDYDEDEDEDDDDEEEE